jgi:exopolyphosphatase / guanosine-5'-triphosphate,3'-diphosphate pyrophosphatase
MSSTEKVAAIDIGTNTILLLIARIEDGRVVPIVEEEGIVRLGEGLQKTGLLGKAAMGRAERTLSRYLGRCRQEGVKRLFAVGTSALREGHNADGFLRRIREKLGLAIEVISGQEEAALSYLAVARDSDDPGRTVLVVDVGGGSTELILGRGGDIADWMSLPAGAVRFTERFVRHDPVTGGEWTALKEAIREALAPAPQPEPPFMMVSVGGTGTTLASVELGLDAFSMEKIHGFILTREALDRQIELYRSRPLEERRKVPGLPLARTDVILAGAAILDGAMAATGAASLQISCHGVRYGLLYQKVIADTRVIENSDKGDRGGRG